MDVVRPLRFQPTIVLCVEGEGRAASNELAALLPSIDAHRRAGIAFLRFDGDVKEKAANSDSNSQGDPADSSDKEEPLAPLLGARYEPDASDLLESLLDGAQAAPPQQTTPQGNELLTTLVVEALRGRRADPGQGRSRGNNGKNAPAPPLGILDDKVIQQIKDDGYAIPDAQVAVWIVASPDSTWLARVTREVRRALASEGVRGRVLLALSNYYDSALEKRETQEKDCREQPWERILISDDANTRSTSGPLADFAYLFEARAEDGMYWNERDIAFAIAETIFILMTTAILSSPEMDNVFRAGLPHLLTSYVERMGGAGTSRLTFPRSHIEIYCASHMAAGLVADWAPKETLSDPIELRRLKNEQDQAAGRWMARVYGGKGSDTWNSDAVIQALPRQKPPVRISPNTRNKDHVLDRFAENDLARFEAGRKDPYDLERLLLYRRARADQRLHQWRTNIRLPWKRYEEAKLADLSAHIKNETLMKAGGVEQVRLYFEALNQKLEKAKEDREQAKVERQRRYAAKLQDYLNRRSDGPWMDLVASPNIETTNPDEGIRPAPSPDQQSDPALVDALSGGGAQQQAQDQGNGVAGPISPEDQIIRQLAARERYYWRQAQTPPSVVPVAVVGTPPMVLGEVALFSALLPFLATPLGIGLLAVITFALLFAGGRALLPKHREHEEAYADLIKFHREVFRYQMQRIEDDRREALLIGLHYEVRNSLIRLENWEGFVAGLQARLNGWAETIEREMFEGSIGRRDILVANQRVFRRDGYGLPQLEHDITRRREDHPRPGAEWHASDFEIVRHLRDEPLGNVSLLKSSEDEIVRPIFRFCRSIVCDYLDGPIADIGLALRAMSSSDKSELLNNLIQRSLILYRPQGGVQRPPVTFIGTRDENRIYLSENTLARDATIARIQDEDWLGTIRVLHGGGQPSFWKPRFDLPPNVPPSPTWTNGTSGQQP